MNTSLVRVFVSESSRLFWRNTLVAISISSSNNTVGNIGVWRLFQDAFGTFVLYSTRFLPSDYENRTISLKAKNRQVTCRALVEVVPSIFILNLIWLPKKGIAV